MKADVFRPFGPLAWVAPLPVIAVASWLLSRPPAGVSYDLWVWASAAVHDSLAISGPLLFLWSSALSARAAGRAWVFSAMPPTTRVRQHLRIALLTTTLGVIAHSVGVLPRLLFAAQTVTDGHLAAASVVAAVAWVAIFCTVGAVCGHALSYGRWLTPIPFVVALALFLPPVYDRAWAILLPNKQWRPDASTQPSWAVTLMVVALATAVIISTLMVVGRTPGPAFRFGSRAVTRPSLGPITGLVAIVTLVAASFVYRPEIYVFGPAAHPVCRSAGEVTVCLHPAHVRSFETVQMSMVQLRAAGLAGYAPKVNDFSLAPQSSTTPGTGLVMAVDPSKTPSDLTRNAVYDLLLTACPEPSGEIGEDDASPFTIAYALVGATLAHLGQPGDGPQTGTVAKSVQKMTARQLADLLRREQVRASSCSLRASDLP